MPVSMNNVSQVNNTQPINQQPKTTDEKTKSFSTKTAVVVGTGLAALAAVGIYLATKGKGGKAVQQATHNTQEAVQNVAQNAQEATNTIKEMTVDAFKQAGNKFNKGKAVTNTGEAFTGNITHQTKDGKKIVMEYENGLLNKSTKHDGENVLFTKEYTNTGKIKTLQTEGQGRKDFYYDNNGFLKSVKYNYTVKDGIPVHDTIIYSPEGNKKMKIQADGWTEFYDKNGVSTNKIHVDTIRGNLYYQDLQYNEVNPNLSGLQRTYSYTTPQGIKGTIARKDNHAQLSFKTPYDSDMEYIVTRNGKDVQIRRSGDKEAIAKDSDEYKNVLAQSNDFMKQFFAKYKTALDLQSQVNEWVCRAMFA